MERVCPLLGLAADGRTAVEAVDAGHRCHAEQPPIPLDRHQQARVCLTDAYERCERYLQHAARTGGLRPRPFPVGDGLVSTRMLLAPDPAWRGIAGRGRRARAGRIAAAGAGLALLGAGGVALASGVLRGEAPAAVGTPTASASAPPSPSPTLAPTATPQPTATPTLAPAAVPTPPPTPVPTLTPTPQLTYVVQEGDTLSAIASRFGTTPGALAAANGISDPNVITIGQVLVIP